MRVSLAIALLTLALVPADVRGQDSSQEQEQRQEQRSEQRTVARYGFTDGAIVISVRPGAIIAVAGAQGDSAATVAFRASDAKAWVDSTRRFTNRAAPRKATVVVLQRSMISEAADSGAVLSFLRRAASDTTTFGLIFSTRNIGKFPLALERREAVLFFAAMRRAINATRPPPAPKAAAKATKRTKPSETKSPAESTSTAAKKP